MERRTNDIAQQAAYMKCMFHNGPLVKLIEQKYSQNVKCLNSSALLPWC